MIRSDAPAKVAGSPAFGVDLDRPGMLWGALVLSPVAHGRIRSLDLEAARRLPGVEAVLGPAEARRVLPRGGNPDRPVFPAEEILYHAQPIAAVAARGRAAARAAARAVRAEIEPLPVRADLDAVFPEWPETPVEDPERVNAHVHARFGDVEGAFAKADRVRRDVFRTSGVAQVPLEPHACLAELRDGRWHVATSTQSPFGVREDAAEILGVAEAELVVEGTWVGGGFGSKVSALLEPYALVLAAASGKPVRLALEYAEEFRLARSTLPARIAIASAVRGGRLVGRTVRLLLDTGAALPGRDFATGYAIGFLLGPYRLPAWEVEGYAVRTNKPPFGSHRAPLMPQCVFATDGHTDQLARDAKVDPFEFRRANLWQEGDATAFGQRVGPFGALAAIEAARQRADAWRRELGPGVGIGVGVGFWSTGTGAGGEARLRLTPERLEIHEGEREIGSGSVVRGLVAVAERALGLPADRIEVVYAPTDSAPFDSGVFGSRTLAALGGAVAAAAGSIATELAGRMGLPGPVRLAVEGGTIVAEAGGRRVRVAELLTGPEREAGGLVRMGQLYGRAGPLDTSRVRTGEFYPFHDLTASVHLAAVRVEPGTGQIRVMRYAAFQDAGTVIDPETFRAQVEGGVAMGLGTALTEEMLWGADGRLENAGLLDYRVPTLTEIPPIEVVPIEGFAGAGPFGAKGIGEPPIIPVPAAVANALADATGARATELPLTPERVARVVKMP
jgi:CO/xanthine dehydrogenase Mo-binding subunit